MLYNYAQSVLSTCFDGAFYHRSVELYRLINTCIRVCPFYAVQPSCTENVHVGQCVFRFTCTAYVQACYWWCTRCFCTWTLTRQLLLYMLLLYNMYIATATAAVHVAFVHLHGNCNFCCTRCCCTCTL